MKAGDIVTMEDKWGARRKHTYIECAQCGKLFPKANRLVARYGGINSKRHYCSLSGNAGLQKNPLPTMLSKRSLLKRDLMNCGIADYVELFFFFIKPQITTDLFFENTVFHSTFSTVFSSFLKYSAIILTCLSSEVPFRTDVSPSIKALAK